MTFLIHFSSQITKNSIPFKTGNVFLEYPIYNSESITETVILPYFKQNHSKYIFQNSVKAIITIYNKSSRFNHLPVIKTSSDNGCLMTRFHMIVTIVAIATIVQKFDCTIATIRMIYGFHKIVAIVAIPAVFIVECIMPADGYSVFTSVVTDSIFPNFESIRSSFKIACYLSVLHEN